jgi:TonB family protein
VARAVVRVGALPVVRVAGGPARDATAVGGALRGRVAELQSCYEREGRARNAALAGMVAVAVTVGGDGRVRAASVTRRSWSGPGVAETEACVLAAVRRWRLPSGEEGSYEIPISFTAGS